MFEFTSLHCRIKYHVFEHFPFLDKKSLEIDARMNMISCPDGRQLLMIMQTTKKDAGVYECVATNPLATVSSSCTISLARKKMHMFLL